DVEVLHGDPEGWTLGMDACGSGGIAVGGVAAHRAGEKIIAKARTLAAHELECAEEDLAFENGAFTVKGTDRSADIKTLGFSSWEAHSLHDGMEPGVRAAEMSRRPT